MSMTNVICQSRRSFVVTDGASYDPDGVLTSIQTKAFAIAHWPGVVTGRGTSVMTPILAWSLSAKFESFDAAVEGIAGVLPGIVADFNLTGHHCELILAGWSAHRQAMESYVIKTTDEEPRNFSDEQRQGIKNGTHYVTPAMQLIRLPDVVAGPVFSQQIMRESGFPGIDLDAEPTAMMERLRFAAECQRQDRNADGKCYVGGYVSVSMITPETITQAIIARWPDKIGELIAPAPADWNEWRSAPKSNVVKMKHANGNSRRGKH